MRPEKNILLREIREKIDSSKAIVLATYTKMSPNMAADFRANIGKTGGSFEVVKKRMLIKAAEQAGFSLDRGDLRGHIGVVFAEQDPVQTTKYVYKFVKENESILKVLGGRFEGALCGAADVELISQLPSQDEMRSQLLGLFEAPMSQTLAVVEALLCSIPFCLENKAAESGEIAESEEAVESKEESSI
ncbi:MAG: 50S ribosomal protein L10 [Verrucomicrobia bacterium]|nr:50S ribosomal protein L10 [Verrucomicrobiota bacterium]